MTTLAEQWKDICIFLGRKADIKCLRTLLGASSYLSGVPTKALTPFYHGFSPCPGTAFENVSVFITGVLYP